jgi:Rrf2 family transcriptional regulator, iron-sulfur cluster assembly transcription factor
MTVFFSKKCELGLQATLFLSTQEEMSFFNAGDISEKLKVPKEFVSKVLQHLTKKGIVGSKKGKSGGFYLAKSPNDIKLIDIVEAIDGRDAFSTCVLGFTGCSPDNPCPVHEKWGKIRTEALQMLSHQTLQELKEITARKISNIK